jgi:disulfide bond formation protein DsbB
MTLLFALLAIAANVATIVIVVVAVGGRFSAGVADQRDSLFESMREYELWFAFTVALVATLGSLYLSEVAHFEPCRLCWYQRIAMYPLALILGIAAARRDHGIRVYAAPIASFGFITIPYMAASAFLLVIALLWVVRTNNPTNAPSSGDLSAANV